MFKVDFSDDQLENVVENRRERRDNETYTSIYEKLIENINNIENFCRDENLDIWKNVKFKEAFTLLKTMET